MSSFDVRSIGPYVPPGFEHLHQAADRLADYMLNAVKIRVRTVTAEGIFLSFKKPEEPAVVSEEALSTVTNCKHKAYSSIREGLCLGEFAAYTINELGSQCAVAREYWLGSPSLDALESGVIPPSPFYDFGGRVIVPLVDIDFLLAEQRSIDDSMTSFESLRPLYSLGSRQESPTQSLPMVSANGRPPKYDVDAFWIEVLRFVRDNGFSDQAEMIKAALDGYQDRTGEEAPSESWARKKMAAMWERVRPLDGRSE